MHLLLLILLCLTVVSYESYNARYSHLALSYKHKRLQSQNYDDYLILAKNVIKTDDQYALNAVAFTLQKQDSKVKDIIMEKEMAIKLKDMERVREVEKEILNMTLQNEKNVMKAYFLKQLSYVTQRYSVLFIKLLIQFFLHQRLICRRIWSKFSDQYLKR